MIRAQIVQLLDRSDRTVARGVVALDDDKGAPPVIIWDGDAYIPADPAGEELCYRETRVMYAGASFKAVR
jgi:hypothetical protein